MLPNSFYYSGELEISMLKEMINSSSDGILLADHDGHVLAYNTAWADLALNTKAKYPKDIQNIYQFPGWMTEKKVTAIEVLRTKRESVNIFRSPAGHVLVSKGRPIFDKDKRLQYVLVNIQDVSSVLSMRDNVENSEKIRKLYIDYMKEASQRSTDTPVVINPKMASIYEKCMTISAVDATVLILGESGTGKEVLANFIHRNSQRKDRPFLSINCGAIPENLLESELFGYEAGAFTGASRTGKAGIFEAANNGTLLLDEMGELPLDMQVKLLRVLETRQITRIGATKPINIDVRIIVATNRNLVQRVKDGLFRQDLYYRINIISITIPPLRERPEDVIALANHFLNLFNIQYGRTRKLSYDAYHALTGYSWPGNVRELRNVIEQLVILSPTDEIPQSLLGSILPREEVGEVLQETVSVNRMDTMERVVDEAERQLLELALQEHHSSRSIAKALGISQTTAVRKLKKHHLETQEI